MKEKINKTKAHKGFTLVETLVAITVLLTAVVGPLTIATNSLNSTQIAKNQLIANLLSQEGIELFRGKRDTNILAGDDWLTSMSFCSSVDGCSIDVINRTILACSSSCDPLSYNTSSFLYGYGTGGNWESTIFTRTIKYKPQSSTEIRVISQIEWPSRSGTKTLTLEESMYNWQE